LRPFSPLAATTLRDRAVLLRRAAVPLQAEADKVEQRRLPEEDLQAGHPQPEALLGPVDPAATEILSEYSRQNRVGKPARFFAVNLLDYKL